MNAIFLRKWKKMNGNLKKNNGNLKKYEKRMNENFEKIKKEWMEIRKKYTFWRKWKNKKIMEKMKIINCWKKIILCIIKWRNLEKRMVEKNEDKWKQILWKNEEIRKSWKN